MWKPVTRLVDLKARPHGLPWAEQASCIHCPGDEQCGVLLIKIKIAINHNKDSVPAKE